MAAHQRRWPYVRVSIIGGPKDPPPSVRTMDCQGSVLGVPLTSLTAESLISYALGAAPCKEALDDSTPAVLA
jgi:hypothetical protein